MRKIPVLSGAFVTTALIVAACGGSTPATVPPVTIPSVAIPSVAIPSFAIPSIAIPSLGLGSFSIPSFVIPSFASDPDLAAKFPKTINGNTVSTPETALYASVIAAFGGNAASDKFIQAMAALNVNPATMSYGNASVDLNESETITALRAPGSSAATILSVAPQLSVLLNPDEAAPTVAQMTIGGKNVTTLTDSDGNVTYFYPSGDTLWETDATDPADLSAIFGALQ